jgi:hypothetical protein
VLALLTQRLCRCACCRSLRNVRAVHRSYVRNRTASYLEASAGLISPAPAPAPADAPAPAPQARRPSQSQLKENPYAVNNYYKESRSGITWCYVFSPCADVVMCMVGCADGCVGGCARWCARRCARARARASLRARCGCAHAPRARVCVGGVACVTCVCVCIWVVRARMDACGVQCASVSI